MRFIITLLGLLFLAACGGGGGSTSTSGSTGTTATAINFTTSLTNAPAITTIVKATNDSSSGAKATNDETTATLQQQGATINIDSSLDTFTVKSTNYWAQPTIDNSFSPSSISSTTSISNSYTLASTAYTYSYAYGSDTRYVTVDIPTNYDYQTWIYWDDDSLNSPGISMANLAITGIFTETSNIPSSGTATYSGGMAGLYSLTGESDWIVLAGDAFFAVNWGTQVVAGSFLDVTQTVNGTTTVLGNYEMPSAASIVNGSFEGDLTGPGFSSYVTNSEIHGSFFGPNAEELAGTFNFWKNNDYTGTAAGWFATKKN